MYAKIASTTWNSDEPTKSCVAGTSGEYAFEFDHERGCPMYERTNRDCTCYVSRIRLVKTPVGQFIPTTEPDLREDVRHWRNRAQISEGYAGRLQVGLWVSLGTAAVFALTSILLVLGPLS